MDKKPLKKTFITVCISILLFSSCSASRQTKDTDATTGNLIIFYEPNTSKEKLLKAAKEYGSEVIYEYKNLNGIAVTIPHKQTASDAILFYKRIEGVLSVTEDTKQELH